MKTIDASRPNVMGTALLRLQLKKTPFISARLFSSLTNYEHAPASSAGESAVYGDALKFQLPTTVRFQENSRNCVSLIGAITKPLRACNAEKFGLYTYLRVIALSRDNRCSEIQLNFWNEMAEVAVQHLKLHDLVYVSGNLQSYLKLNEDESSVLRCSVNVKEMNFVARETVPEACQYIVKTKGSYEESMQKRRNTLHLWQAFFANPSDWWDNRNSKSTPRCPDFKHKDIDEALWISKNDPLWINEQLQLYDSRMSKQSDVHQKSSCEEIMQKHRDRLHLWQVLFANPSEWWDNRKCKLTSRCPDFTHKDTNEGLWIKKNDPPWINEQLQLYDSRLSKVSDVHQKSSYEEIMQKRRNRLHLWQVFFANPLDWWDNRNSKLKSRSPDFRHRDTDEALWIFKNDPPWVHEQLKLYDSRLSKQSDVHQTRSYEECMQKRRERLHLWQIFFANPSEWWDNRNCKLTPTSPDFTHKDTDEALWIKKNDPPWINKQLQLYDSRLSKRSNVHQNSASSHLSPLFFNIEELFPDM